MSRNEFRVSAEIKNILGKDLITDDFVAIFELVKNSYDAYATNVVIEFQDDAIIISDNGHGMSRADIDNKWLFLGYSAKKNGIAERDTEVVKQMTNKVRRHYAGAKGIGRLSCDRIASSLILTSKDEKSNLQHTVEVDWSKFENIQDQEFGSVDVNIFLSDKLIQYPSGEQTGTILKLNGLHSHWEREKIRNLRKSLEKLINPFDENSDFMVEIIAKNELENDDLEPDRNNRINGPIKNRIADVLELKTTRIKATLDGEYITTELSDRGETIYAIEEDNTDYIALKKVTINLYFLNRSAKLNFSKLMGVTPTNYGSVFMFRNGFRVFPYGEAGDDSWGLDKRALQGYNRFLGTRDLFGRVDIITDNIDEFKEASSRDAGLIRSKTADQLMDFFSKIHRRLERYVAGVLWGESFKRKDYFVNNLFAEHHRKDLKQDQDNSSPNAVFLNLGSRIDYLQLVKSLVKDKAVKVLFYNEQLLDVFSKESDIGSVNQKVFNDFEEFAASSNSVNLQESISKIRSQLSEAIRDRNIAEEQYRAEVNKRIEAEKKAEQAKAAKEEEERLRKIADLKKTEAEQVAKAAELQKREAEVKKIEAEKKRDEESRLRKAALLNKQIAEQEAKESELKEREALLKAKEEEQKRIIVEKELSAQKQSTEYFQSTRNLSDEVDNMLHVVALSSSDLNAIAIDLDKQIYSQNMDLESVTKLMDELRFHIDKIMAFTRIMTKADSSMLKDKVKVDIVEYLKQYLKYIHDGINVNVTSTAEKPIIRKIALLSFIVILQNMTSNSQKNEAKNINIMLALEGRKVIMDFSDDGIGVDMEKYNKESIFYKGVTNRKGGSGIGLATIKDVLINYLDGDIEYVGNGLNNLKGATFRIYLN